MSERMIELQRAKLGLPPAGSSPAPSVHNAARSPGKGNLQSPKVATVQQTPEETAVSEQLSEDAQIQKLIHRLQRRDDLHPASSGSNGPTVPTALSRRMLHRQGVGYLDDTVASAISASADRFLATVLQQAVACRDQRLKGAEMARDAARHRKRHMQHYEADTDDRKRRREAHEAAKEKAHLQTIHAAETLKKGGSSKSSDDKKKKKKTKDGDDAITNGSKTAIGKPPPDDDDDFSYDSIDEEEEYYQEKIADTVVQKKGEEEDDDDTLLLKDLVRPLEAWDFHITGKEALEEQDSDSDSEEGDAAEDEEDKAELAASRSEDNGNDEGASAAGSESQKSENNKAADDDGEADSKPKASSTAQAKKS
mmetsp:Transcript_71431/g.206825  ORF Transcript_71431/g.206825 Transcript_71431/m.206825 type:complete len:366 (-) Transcript_71431:161-1258(-)|eukprot:CAMPEP_0176054636 /NCGR_PEP_ID=MMETSP0120_2-20121206/27187_1 /TAXON_ID=160619 /ORGANISM="Kryptoperidinium foliaceum, Strain CCMP 1326" /LENGTH=365 /DNA_ID=CAMNT_0017388107 /DNA_START=341 /DNA_END=1438 /DNA_ORIENTATION=-